MKWKNASRALSIAAAAIGALGFAGWVFGIDALKRIHPAWVTMKANTGLCLMLAGLAAALLHEENESGFRRRVAQACGVIIAAVGFITFGEQMGWWQPWLDQTLFFQSVAEAGRSFPGRMNPPSTLNFMLLGLAVLLLDAPPHRGAWPAQLCALAVIVNTFLVFLAYFYGLEIPLRLEIYVSIALHTAIAFLLLAAAILLARPDRGMMAVFLANNIGGVIARRLLPAALLLPALLGWLATLGRNAGYYGRDVGTALFATSLTLIFTGLVWWAAKALATSDVRRRSSDAARARLAAIVEFSTDAILSKNLDGIITSWNAGAERLFGYKADEMIGQPVTRIIPADRQNEEVEILRRLRAGQAIDHYETTREGKGGRAVEVSLSISPIRNETDVVVGASKIVRDITARKQAETALAQQRKWFQVTLSSIGDGVIATDANSAITFLNPIAETMTGWTSTEAHGRSLSEVFQIINEDTRDPVENPVARVLREGAVVGLVNHAALVARDGRVLSVEDSAAPIKDAAGRLVGAVMVFHDVTERRRDAAVLAQAHARAEAANRAKDDFLAVLSHELRTPLTPALVAASDLEASPPSDPAVLRASLALIRRNIELEARLVDDLLDLTRISRGKLRIASAPVDLHVTLRDALAIAEPMLRERNIAISIELTAERHLVRGDAARLAQVFANLLTNAAKFTPDTGRVTVRTQSHDGKLRVEVSDTGIGIAPEVLPHIFEAFRQGEVSTTRRFGGLGLGLSVAKSLVEAHGGTIAARSDGHDRGATFSVTLPALEATALLEEDSGSAVPFASSRSLHVLLVEDHEDTRHVLQRLIARGGHTATAVGSVRAAQEKLAGGHFDLVLTDLGLPDGTGFDVIAALREKSDSPAVAMSGYGMNTDLERTRAAGFAEHIVKPLTADNLQEILTRYSAQPAPPDRSASHA